MMLKKKVKTPVVHLMMTVDIIKHVMASRGTECAKIVHVICEILGVIQT